VLVRPVLEYQLPEFSFLRLSVKYSTTECYDILSNSQFITKYFISLKTTFLKRRKENVLLKSYLEVSQLANLHEILLGRAN
jgi:hypothetical protein